MKERRQNYPVVLLAFRAEVWQSKGRGFESPQLHFEAKKLPGNKMKYAKPYDWQNHSDRGYICSRPFDW